MQSVWPARPPHTASGTVSSTGGAQTTFLYDASPRNMGCELLADLHCGDCGDHSSSRTLMGKVFCSGFY